MQKGKKRIFIGLCLLCLLGFTACGKKEEPSTQTIVYEFGDAAISYGEFFIYAQTVKEDYQKTYGNGIWSLELATEFGTDTVKEITIRDLVDDINRVKVLIHQAEEMKLVLSDNEKETAKQSAQQFFSGLTEQDKKDSEITKEIVEQVLLENMLAQKVYASVIDEYDFEISEEEARMTTFFDMVFECYRVKQDGSVEEYTEEKKALQLERANEALATLAQEEDVTYDDVVDKYDLEYSAQHTMSKTEMMEEYGETIANKLLSLSDGEISVVIESDYGYHIFKMLQSNNEDLTKKNKAEIIEKKQHEYFASIYREWIKKYDSKFEFEEDVNMDAVAKFQFD